MATGRYRRQPQLHQCLVRRTSDNVHIAQEYHFTQCTCFLLFVLLFHRHTRPSRPWSPLLVGAPERPKAKKQKKKNYIGHYQFTRRYACLDHARRADRLAFEAYHCTNAGGGAATITVARQRRRPWRGWRAPGRNVLRFQQGHEHGLCRRDRRRTDHEM